MLLNEVTFAGNAGKDAEDFTTPTGTRIVSFSLCHTDKSNNQEKTTWLRVKVFGGFAEPASRIKKGDNVIVRGRLQEAKWKDKDTGQERVMIECIAFQIGVLPRETRQSASPSDFDGNFDNRPKSASTYTSLEDIPF